MAVIEIVYMYASYCKIGHENHCKQCHSIDACELDCECFVPRPKHSIEKLPRNPLPCARAIVHYVRKGWSGKNYEIAPKHDFPNDDYPEYPAAIVKLGQKTYYCAKVTLDGKVIFNNYDDEASAEETPQNKAEREPNDVSFDVNASGIKDQQLPTEERYTTTDSAKAKKREYYREWRRRNRDKIRNYEKKYWTKKAEQAEHMEQLLSASNDG